MAESPFATREDLEELKSKGVVFNSPLATRCLVLAALAGSGVALWGRIPAGALPDNATAALEFGREVGLAALVLCLATIAASVAVGLACNGFTLSAGLLSVKLRPLVRENLLLSLAAGILAGACSVALGYRFAAELFVLLQVEGAPGLTAALAEIGLKFIKVVAGSALALALLVAVVARMRFLLIHRPRRGARE